MWEPDDCFALSVGAGRSVSNRPRSTSSQPTRRRVHNMPSWLEALTLYPRVLVDASPDRAGQLLAYLALILANNNYHSDAWLAYDLPFRQVLATQSHQHSWTTIDMNLWQACFTSRGREACIPCHIVHPIVTSQCPFRSGGLMVSSNAASFTPKHEGKQIRKNYNRTRCTYPSCTRSHVCLLCRGKQPKIKCPKPQPHKALRRLILLLSPIHLCLYLD